MKAPTAAERTVSLFTGKTDLDDPNARDGSPPGGPLTEGSGRRRRLRWNGGLSRWWVGPLTDPEFVIEKLGEGQYRAERHGRVIGTFETIGLAGLACEERAR